MNHFVVNGSAYRRGKTPIAQKRRLAVVASDKILGYGVKLKSGNPRLNVLL
jgi:hypothetical protein